MLLKLNKREEIVYRGLNFGVNLIREALIEARAGREIVFEELVEKPWLEKGKTKETMTNFFDMKTRYVGEYVEEVVARISRDIAAEKAK